MEESHKTFKNNEIGQLKQIAHLMNTQDNRITSDPLFLVEKMVRHYGYDLEWADDYIWQFIDEYDEETLEILEDDNPYRSDEVLNKFSQVSEDWHKLYYKERWEFVTAFFTEKACLKYIESHKCKGEKMRSYAISCYDNYEMILIRKLLGRKNG